MHSRQGDGGLLTSPSPTPHLVRPEDPPVDLQNVKKQPSAALPICLPKMGSKPTDLIRDENIQYNLPQHFVVGQLLRKIKMSGPQAEKTVKKIETGDMKVGELAKKFPDA